MLMGIFVESNEDLGLMYEGYKDIPDIVKKFLGFVHKAVDHASDEGIPEDDISSELKKFKQDCKTSMIKPVNTSTDDLKSVIEKIKNVSDKTKECLEELGEVREKFRFGKNLIHGVIIKPKVYTNSTDEENLSKVNKFMRQGGVALDWIEKVIMDLMNMCSQDLNLATVMDAVHFRECHETSDFMEEIDEFLESDIMNTEFEIDD